MQEAPPLIVAPGDECALILNLSIHGPVECKRGIKRNCVSRCANVDLPESAGSNIGGGCLPAHSARRFVLHRVNRTSAQGIERECRCFVGSDSQPDSVPKVATTAVAIAVDVWKRSPPAAFAVPGAISSA